MTQNAKRRPPAEGAAATIDQHVDTHPTTVSSDSSPALTAARQALAAGMAPVALYGVGPDGQTCHCSKGRRCPSKGKHPINSAWASEPFPSGADIEAMWDRRPKANVGIRTGSVSNNLIVLDIDHGGRETLAPLVHAGGGMPETLVVQTGSGGQHFYFYAPSGVEVRNSQSKVAAHVDIRGEGGQAVGPGSRTDKGEYTILHRAPIAAAPQWLIEAATADRTAMPTEAPTAAPKRPQTAEEASYEQNMLNKQLGRLAALQNEPWTPGDAWDPTCFEVACHLVELANSEWASITHEEAHQRYMSAAPTDSEWDEREAKWEQAVKQAGDKAKAGPSGSLVEAHSAAPAGAPPSAPTRAHRVQETDSDATMVDEFAERGLQGKAVYVEKTNTWRVYDESIGIWDESTDRTIREMFRRYVLEQNALASLAFDVDRVKLLNRYTQGGKIKTVAELSAGRVKVKPEIFDQHPDLLVVGNGVVDLRTSTLRPFDPGLLMTKRTAVPYVPGATHPDWDEALTATADEEVRDWLQLTIGQGATGYAASSDVMPICIGGGSNGKSAIFAPLVPVLGHYGQPVTEKVLIADAKEHSTDLTDLQGLRVALLEELPEESRLNAKRLKDMLGTKAMKARRMRENNITWRPTHSLFVTTNHTPSVSGADDATWRRLALVRFPWHYVSSPDPSRPEERPEKPRLRDDLEQGHDGRHEAVLAWIVQGAKRWYDGGRVLPKDGDLPFRVVTDTVAWRHDQDAILRWFDTDVEIVTDPRANCSTTDLHTSFIAAMEGDPEHATWSQNKFTTALLDHPIVKGNPRISYNRRATASAHEEHRSKPSNVMPSTTGERYAAIFGVRFKPKADQGVDSMVVKPAENTL